jgi:hypothetical protein
MLKVVMGMYGHAGGVLQMGDQYVLVVETQPKQIASRNPTLMLVSRTVELGFVTKQPIASSTRLDRRCLGPLVIEAPYLPGVHMDETLLLVSTIPHRACHGQNSIIAVLLIYTLKLEHSL